ncbi:TAXI family TRAP transporter solute-binding subunit [Pseudonocardia sp. CA-107938]|uniref:TAXI family TRAP transporter solute-binding subunit n=1 Tax=Pseudonocardia sp. CA-107938 TaxID=3240021 RepID=UPI003D8FBAE7
MTATRRAVLRAAGIGVLAAACSPGAPPRLAIAGGEDGGFYLEFAGLLATQLSVHGRPAAALPTGGSVENIQLVRDGRATVGLTLADVVDGARRGTLPVLPAPVPLLAVGRVYENYMQLVVRAEDGIRSTQDLAGRVVSPGAVGSGAAVFGERLLTGVPTAGIVHLPLRGALDALEHHRIDALLWSGGVPTPALADFAARRPVRLLPLDGELARLQGTFGEVYRGLAVPAGVYGATGAVTTIGVANLITCAPDAPDDVVDAIATTLATAAAQLVPRPALGTHYLDLGSLIGTGSVPLHPGARAAYRRLHG